MDIFEIDVNSDAGKEIARIMADKNTYKIRISPNSSDSVKVKRNEDMWSAPLSTVRNWTYAATH